MGTQTPDEKRRDENLSAIRVEDRSVSWIQRSAAEMQPIESLGSLN